MSRGREMAPLHAGLCFNVGPGGPRGARPTLASRPCRSQLSRAEERGGCCVQRDPCLRCAVLGMRAPGVKGSSLVSPGHTFAIRAAKREAAGAGAPAPPPRLTPTREGGGEQAAATLEDYAPVRKAQAPAWGLRSSGRAPSRQRGLPARGDVLRGGWSATGARPFLARTSLDLRAGSAARWLSSP